MAGRAAGRSACRRGALELRPAFRNLGGSFVLHDFRTPHANCVGQAGFDDIKPGLPVTVKDGAGYWHPHTASAAEEAFGEETETRSRWVYGRQMGGEAGDAAER